MVIAIHEEDVARWPEGLDGLQRRGDPGGQRRWFGWQIHAMRIGIAHIGSQDPATIRRFPGEGHAVDGEGNAAPDGGVSKAELAVDLRHLCRVAEGIGKVADAHRSAMRVGGCDPTLEVANQGLATDQELVGEGVPRPDLDLAPAYRRLQSGLRLRTDLKIIVDYDCLPVHQETEIGIRLGQHQ